MTLSDELKQTIESDKINFQADDQTYNGFTVLKINCGKNWTTETLAQNADYIQKVMDNSDKPVHRIISMEDFSTTKLAHLALMVSAEPDHKNRGEVIISCKQDLSVIIKSKNMAQRPDRRFIFVKDKDGAVDALLQQFETQ